jgi:hypothetical protein
VPLEDVFLACYDGLKGPSPARQITAQGMSQHSVATVIAAVEREGIDSDTIADLTEAEMIARLFPRPASMGACTRSPTEPRRCFPAESVRSMRCGDKASPPVVG